MESILNPRKYFGITPENCHNVGVCLLDKADMMGQQLGPSRQT